MRKIVQPRSIISKQLFVIALILQVAYGCSKTELDNRNEYLIRLGAHTVTVLDYEKAFAIAKTAYSTDIAEDKETYNRLQLRTLNQMIEELILQKKAEENNIIVTDEELDAAIKQIRSDYPDQEFEQVLLENVLSYDAWKNGLKNRLLMEKVVDLLIAPNINVSPEEITEYVKEMSEKEKDAKDPSSKPAEALESEEYNKTDDEKVIDYLRRKRIEEAYKNWIDEYKETYNIDINNKEWLKILET